VKAFWLLFHIDKSSKINPLIVHTKLQFNPHPSISAPRVRCCLCAVGLLPALLLFLLFALVWLSELRLL
jgi:hypothetical protein